MYTGPQDTRVLTGVMDQDSAAWAMKPENYRYALNLINSYNEQRGSHTNIKGMLEVVNTALKNGVNKCVGTFEDIRDQSVIFLVYNQFGYDAVFRWYQNKGVIETVFQVYDPSVYDQYNPNPLGFHPDFLVTGINLVDDLLCWTDYYGSPKVINVRRSNETDKKREFNLYFNDNTFGEFTNGLTHTLSLYVQGQAAPVSTFTWVMPFSVSNYAQAVENMISQYGGSVFANYVNLINKGNYVLAQINTIGIYTLEWTNNAFAPYYSGVIVPENFYPDRSGTTVSYAPTSVELVERVKYPPMCRPSGRFKVDGAGSLSYNMTQVNLQNQFIGPGIPFANYYTFRYYSGISSVNNDSLSLVQTGSTVVIGPSTPTGYGVFNAYIENTLPYPITLDLTVQLSIGLSGWSGLSFPPGNQAFVINLGVNTNTSTPPSPLQQIWAWNTSYVGEGEFDPLTIYNVVRTTQITLQPGQRLGTYSTSSGIVGSFTGAVSAVVTNASLNYYQSNTFPQFRAKYIYKDYQNSVYGAISPTIVSPTPKYSSIEVDFTDPRLESPELVSDIRNVVLSVSLDAGVTWNDFATLDPYEFAGPGRQKYTYRGNEVLIAVPEAEAILQYHNVPRKSKAQEYIEDRIWDGKLLTGYNIVQIDMDLEVLYENIFDGEFLVYQTQRPFVSVSRWKRGWKGWVGVVYYDSADRKSPVCLDPVNSYIEIPYYNDTQDLNPSYLKAKINSAAPDWAVKYQFVRSQNLDSVDYLMWCPDECDLVDDNDNIVSASLAKYIRIKLDNIAYYTDKAYKGSQISFTYVDGDRIKFVMNPSGVFYPSNDYVIAKVSATSIYIVYDASITPVNGSLIELYSPATQADKLLYYEFGECYAVDTVIQNSIKVKRHKGGIQDQVYPAAPLTVGTPAETDIKTGDVWYRSRDLYYDTTAVVTFTTKYINSNTPSDYTVDIHTNNSRPNSTDILGEVYDDTAFVFSDQYISGTRLNGLNAVQPANYKKLNTTYGPLNKMQVVGNDILKLLFGNGYQLSIYVNQGVIRQTQGGGNIISVLNEVAANSHLIQRTLGTINAESVVLNDDGDVFGYDGTEGACWMAAGNGTVDISDTGMSMTWRNYGLSRLLLSKGTSQTPSAYDLGKNQYIITLNAMNPQAEVLPSAYIKLAALDSESGTPQIKISIEPLGVVYYNNVAPALQWPLILKLLLGGWNVIENRDGSVNVSAPDQTFNNQNLVITVNYNGKATTYSFSISGGVTASSQPPFPALTLAYSKNSRGWTTYYSFTPEMYGRLRNQLVSFVDGKLYLHDLTATYNNFYGVQYDSIIRYILNNDYPKVKVPISVWYRGQSAWGSIIRNPSTSSYPYGQETEMTPAHFILEEDGYYSEVMKNRLDPRYPTIDQAWVNGEDIRGDAPEVEFYHRGSSQARLDSTKTLYLYSENS